MELKVRVAELMVGDIVTPTNRKVLGVYASAYREMRGKREVILDNGNGTHRSATWGANTTVTIIRESK